MWLVWKVKVAASEEGAASEGCCKDVVAAGCDFVCDTMKEK